MSHSKLDSPHRRHNPLTDEWVLVSPHRTKRPWQGKVESASRELRPQFDPTCYLCPGNDRAGGHKNPVYENTFVFDNDFAALLPDSPAETVENELLMEVDSVVGTCRVVCFSPRHDLSLAEMQEENIRKVVDLWAGQIDELGNDYTWVQVFENKGEIMGCSNPHPHGQIWASNSLPNEPFKENREQQRYYKKHNANLLLDYLKKECKAKERIVVENEHWVVLVPFWAVWPFETLLLPKRHVLRLPDLNDAERNSLANILKRHLTRYDNLFETSFPYSMGWHGAPTDNNEYNHWQLHAHFYPPLLRSATVKKFIVGYEMLSEVQRDITPEQAAKRLQELSEIHYRKASK
ncbi:MAG: UDP-glucose--hexose-1-phosphate uridylyltransferase [Calditrichaeota bacterium]|nr:MAG: UDP-glucose--hexose-1-phosphate uridylyltransferase [Calditrichota bacterium]